MREDEAVAETEGAEVSKRSMQGARPESGPIRGVDVAAAKDAGDFAAACALYNASRSPTLVAWRTRCA